MLAEFLYVNGFQGDATSKRIPEWIYQLDESKQLSFIRGFINADGSVFTDKWNVNRYQIELNNKSLVEDLKALLDRLNIKCSKVSERGYEGMTEICGIPCHRNKSYYIYFYLDGTRRSQEKKYKKLESDQFILVPITKIEEAEEQETFDIQVESESSNFIANGIIVHNSMIESARRVWKQLSLMEDAMLIHRIMRAPERRIFKIDVGTIPPAEVDAYMEKLMNKMQKVPYMDDRTGDYNLRFNLQTMVEDFYLPVRGGDSGTSIDTLSGMEWTGIEDLDYIKHKMMAALKIPKAFLGFEEGLSGKATLASEDVRFARTIQRIQRIVASELQKIAIVHLYSQGYRDEDLVDFELELTNPSTVFEREKVEIWSDKVAVATDMLDVKLFSKDWIYKNVFNMSDEDKQMVNDQVIEDTKQKYRLTSIEEEGNDPAKPVQKIGGDEIEGGGDEGPDLGGAEAGPDEGPKGGEGPGGGAGGPPGGGGEGPLKEETIKPILERRPERDQTGLKDASDFKYRYGEDYDGHLEMNSKPGSEREIRPNPRRTRLGMEEEIGGRPIIDQGTIENLKEFLFKPLEQVEKELLLELQQRSGSLADFLDEKNILEE